MWTSFVAVFRKELVEASADVQGQNSDKGAVLFFFFPRTDAIAADDKEVELSAKLGRLELKTKFRLAAMMFQGKLEL